MRYADFPTLVDALDYAALSSAGMNFYDRRCQLEDQLEYQTLKARAEAGAKRLLSLNLKKGDRVALIAETSSGFVEAFFACQYAGLVAVPLAIPMGVGQRDSWSAKLQGLLASCQPAAIITGDEWLPLVNAATHNNPELHVLSHAWFKALPEADVALQRPVPNDIAYLQYTSGSTRFPRGVIITHREVMANLRAISHDGIKLRPGDRCVSWLPFYHDMGLVGFLLTPVATQLSVDYLRTQDFAMRPLQWLKLISKNRGTVSVAPPFGYELCQRRVNEKDLAELDLSCWRVAGIGAEPISAEQLHQFAECFRQVNFDDKTFMPCYGLAENALAVSFSDEACGVVVNEVDRDILEYQGKAVAPGAETRAVSTFVNCGKALPEHGIEIRNEADIPVAERVVGHICISGPSLMSGYFGDQVSQDEIAATGWLDTGDLGYLLDGYLYVTGRIKDLIIIRGRNIWPQDIEYIAEQEPEIHSGDAIAFVTAQEKSFCRSSVGSATKHVAGSLSTRWQLGSKANLALPRISICCRPTVFPEHPPASLPVRKRKTLSEGLCCQSSCAGIPGMNQTVAVTGATGFIGKYIIDNLLARGFHVRALTRTARAHVNDNLTWVRGSLEDTHSLSELVAGASAVVHCAGQVRGHKEEIFTRCNVDGSLRLMQAAKESGFCQRFLFISSLAARHPELSWYANSKHVAEQRLTAMADEITLGVFRPTAVYGPGDKELKPLFDWMLRGLLPRLGTPETLLSFLHVTDFAQAVGQWLSAETVQTQTYELCDGVAGGYDWQRVQQLVADVRCGSVRMVGIPLPLLTCLADISTALSRLAGKEPMLTRSKIRELTHADWSASNNRISEDINWFPGISLEHALRNGLF